MRLRELAAILFIAAIGSSLVQMSRRPARETGKTAAAASKPSPEGGFESVAIALDLVEHGSFGNPFAATAKTGPTAHLPPLYPLFVAATLRICRSGSLLIICTLLVHGLHASLLPWVSRLLFGRAGPGIWGALLAIALPVFTLMPTWDAMYTAAGLMLFCLFTSWLAARGGNTIVEGALAGLAGAVLILTNVSASIVVLCWTLYLAARLKPRRRIAPFCAAFALAVVVACVPWTVRNYRMFHQVVWIRDSLGIELYVSNNDCAESSQDANIATGCHARTHPTRSQDEALLLVRMGEVRYNQYRLATAIDWIRSRPRRFAALTGRRMAEFWLPPGSPAVAAITWLSLAGFILMAIRKTPALAFIASVVALYPLIYYVVQSSPRYRYPIMWISLLGAGYALAELAAMVLHRRIGTDGHPERESSQRRGLAGIRARWAAGG